MAHSRPILRLRACSSSSTSSSRLFFFGGGLALLLVDADALAVDPTSPDVRSASRNASSYHAPLLPPGRLVPGPVFPPAALPSEHQPLKRGTAPPNKRSPLPADDGEGAFPSAALTPELSSRNSTSSSPKAEPRSPSSSQRLCGARLPRRDLTCRCSG